MIKNLPRQFLMEEEGAGFLEYLLLIFIVGITLVIIYEPFRSWFAKLTDVAFCKIRNVFLKDGTAIPCEDHFELGKESDLANPW